MKKTFISALILTALFTVTGCEEGKVAVNELRDKLNFGRKLTVQLMEYFDRTGFLRRKGNDHILRDKDTFDL